MPTFGTFTDSRDGHVYKTVLMPDGNWWAAENLAWTGTGVDYNNDPANRATYGRLYNWDEAATSCPSGTHLPSESEISAMLVATGAYSGARVIMIPSWSGGTDEYGFSAIPAGFYANGFSHINYAAWFWSSTTAEGTGARCLFFTASNEYPIDPIPNFSWYERAFKYSVRFIVNPPPNYVSLYGAETQGFERGYSVEVSRPIAWQDTLGFAPVGIPYAPADKDEWIVDAELWVSAAQATALEAAVPPFGVPSSRSICVPNRGGENTFAGLAPATFGSIADAYADPVVLEWESLGQKGPRLELYGYRIKFSLSCSSTSNPYSSNPATAPTTTPPAWLLNKFRAHQIQDGSVEARVIGPNGKWTGSANPIKSGRRRDLNFNLDHLSPAQMDELVAFYRGIRSNEFYLWTDANPLPNFLPHPFKAVGLSFQRGAGLWWDATLELVRA